MRRLAGFARVRLERRDLSGEDTLVSTLTVWVDNALPVTARRSFRRIAR